MTSWQHYALHHEELGIDQENRTFAHDQKTCVARLMDVNHAGENRFYVAPAIDGSWFAWGDWHNSVENQDEQSPITLIHEQANDATYTFVNGSAFFPTREAAMAAVYRWLKREVEWEFKSYEPQNSRDSENEI